MGVAYSPDGIHIAVTDMVNNRVSIFRRTGTSVGLLRSDAEGGDPKVREPWTQQGDPGIREPWDVAYSPDGQISALNSGRLYDKSGKFLRALPAGGVGVSFFPDGQRLAIVSSVGVPRVRVFDLQGVQLNAFGNPMGPGQEGSPGLMYLPMGISCSPDGKVVAVVDERPSRLLCFDSRGTHLYSLDGKDGKGPEEFGYPRGVAFSPDGSRLALADVDNERVPVFATAGGNRPAPVPGQVLPKLPPGSR